MKIQVSFSELSNAILSHYGQNVSFSFLSDRSVEAVVRKKALLVTIPIPVRLNVKSVRKTEVEVEYHIMAGVDKVVGMALAALIEKYPVLKSGVEMDNEVLRVDFTKIKQAEVFVKNFELRDVRFGKTGLDIEVSVKQCEK